MDGAGWVELMNLKVIAVWASTLPSLPQSSRSALLSRFLPAGRQRSGGWKQPRRARGPPAPTVPMLIIDQMIKADEEIYFWVESERGAIVRLRLVWRELPKDQYFQSRQRALLSVTLSKVITIES